MRKVICSVILFFALHSVQAAGQNETVLKYIDEYKWIAIQQMHEYHIPASITLAQGIIESGAGLSELAIESNNHFGIKCHSDWKGDKVYYDDDAKDECFRKYDAVEDSYKDHSEFLSNNTRYTSLFDLKTTDYKGWAKGLKSAGYATNPKYADMLIDVIEMYHLDAYDEMTLADVKKNKKEEKSESAEPSGDKKASDKKQEKNKKSKKDKEEHFSWNGYSADVFYFNRIPAVKVKAGDTPESLAAEHKVKASLLTKYNDVKPGTELAAGTNFYLQPKRKKGAVKYHVVKSGESMFTISRDEGVVMEELYARNKLVPGEEPAEGEKLNLRHNRKEKPLLQTAPVQLQAKNTSKQIKEEKTDNRKQVITKNKEQKDPESGHEAAETTMVFDTEMIPEENTDVQENEDAADKEIKKAVVEESRPQPDNSTPVYHEVMPKETLYSLSKKYGVQTSQLQEWNSLTGNDIRIGQQLIVGYH